MAAIEDEQLRRRFQKKIIERWNEDWKPPEEDKSTTKLKKSPFSLHNFVLLAVAISVFYFSDFLSVLFYDGRIRKTWFWIGVAGIGIHVGIASFLVVWINFWKSIDTEEWEKLYPKAVPLATASFIFGGFCFAVALWPVWGFLTPIILGSIFMGAIVVVAMFG